MPIVTLDIPARLIDAIATRNGFTGFLKDGVTPETKKDFIKRVLSRWVKSESKSHEAAEAAATAARVKENEIEAIEIT